MLRRRRRRWWRWRHGEMLKFWQDRWGLILVSGKWSAISGHATFTRRASTSFTGHATSMLICLAARSTGGYPHVKGWMFGQITWWYSNRFVLHMRRGHRPWDWLKRLRRTIGFTTQKCDHVLWDIGNAGVLRWMTHGAWSSLPSRTVATLAR